MFGGKFESETEFPCCMVDEMLKLAYKAECNWCDEAIALLVAHRLTEMARAGCAGSDDECGDELMSYIAAGSTLSNISVAQGSNSASFNPPPAAENRFGIGMGDNLSSTVWGRMLLSLRPETFNVGCVL